MLGVNNLLANFASQMQIGARSMDKSFERTYSVNVARLKPGKHQESFEIHDDFFEHFEQSIIDRGNVQVDLDMIKYGTHLDVTFNFSGAIQIACDRCGEPYSHPVNHQERIIYSFDKEMDFEGYEVMYADPKSPSLSIVQELYDFLSISLPLRRVPEPEVHLCSPEVLEILGLDDEGNVLKEEPASEEIDPRWETLRKLRDQLE